MRLKLFDRFQLPHLLDQGFQRFDGHVLDFSREISLEGNMRRPERRRPEPGKRNVPRRRIAALECLEVRLAHLSGHPVDVGTL